EELPPEDERLERDQERAETEHGPPEPLDHAGRQPQEQEAPANAEPALARTERDPARDQRKATADERTEERAPDIGRLPHPVVERVALDESQPGQQKRSARRRDDPARRLHPRVVGQDRRSDYRATRDEADRAEEPCHLRTHTVGCGRGWLKPDLRHHLLLRYPRAGSIPPNSVVGQFGPGGAFYIPAPAVESPARGEEND